MTLRDDFSALAQALDQAKQYTTYGRGGSLTRTGIRQPKSELQQQAEIFARQSAENNIRQKQLSQSQQNIPTARGDASDFYSPQTIFSANQKNQPGQYLPDITGTTKQVNNFLGENINTPSVINMENLDYNTPQSQLPMGQTKQPTNAIEAFYTGINQALAGLRQQIQQFKIAFGQGGGAGG